jgi:hypothetical protein
MAGRGTADWVGLRGVSLGPRGSFFFAIALAQHCTRPMYRFSYSKPGQSEYFMVEATGLRPGVGRPACRVT